MADTDSTITYTDEMFSEEQIAEAVAALSGYERYNDVATLAAGEYGADVLEAFAKLARALKSDVSSSYGNLAVKRERPLADRRQTALYSLRYKAERGQITPANMLVLTGEED